MFEKIEMLKHDPNRNTTLNHKQKHYSPQVDNVIIRVLIPLHPSAKSSKQDNSIYQVNLAANIYGGQLETMSKKGKETK